MVIIGISALGYLLKAKVYNMIPKCVPSILEIMFGTRAYLEITCSVRFFKSYKPVTEVVSAKLQQAITFEKGYRTCNFCSFSEK
jgi:hypothetical protein